MAFIIGFSASLVLAFFLQGTREDPRRLGGFAVLGGLLPAVAFDYGWPAFFTLRVFWLCLGLLFVMGAVDDWVTLRPFTKFFWQLSVAVLFLGLTSPSTWGGGLVGLLGWAAYPVWLFWLVGITNSLNLLDNMDGLTPGVGAVAALGFAWLGLGAGWVLLPLSGALFGFLGLNFYRARIHLGDSGSHLVGFSLAVLPLYGAPHTALWTVPLILALPICDTAFVTVTRLKRGVSPFQGGKDHLSHRLARLGIAPPVVAASFLGGAGLLVGLAALWSG
ncbi:MAG: MraY family glycosyltransferase [Acidobacteriota bacterium]